MKWSWKIGQFAGINVYIHATFLLLIAWLAVSHWLRGHTISAALTGIAFIVALFGCVLLHEFRRVAVASLFAVALACALSLVLMR